MATDSIKLYGGIYVALLTSAFVQWALFETDVVQFTYGVAVVGVLVLSLFKSWLVVSFFQHLWWENRSLSYLVVLTLALVVMLMAAASFSVT